MKKFKIICELLHSELSKSSVVKQNVYFNSLFEKLIKHCKQQLINSSSTVLFIGYDNLVNLIDSHWSGLKYLNRDKKLVVTFFENIVDIDWLVEYEMQLIEQRMKKDNGIFCSNFHNNAQTGLIVLNDELPIFEFERVLTHELIHFFQWNIGKSIHQFKRSDLTEKDFEEIYKVTGIEKSSLTSILNHIQDSRQLQCYCNNIFSYLVDLFKQYNIAVNKHNISIICDCFKNNGETSFYRYYISVVNNLKNHIGIEYDRSTYLTYLLLLGFFNHGFNSFKNHIFSYLNIYNSKLK